MVVVVVVVVVVVAVVLVWQLFPEKPSEQVQVYELPSTEHVPPLEHGFEEQGSISQFAPEKPSGQPH